LDLRVKLRKYTVHQLKDAVKHSISLRQVLQRLSIAAYGDNYDVLRKAIRFHGIDISHSAASMGQATNISTQAADRALRPEHATDPVLLSLKNGLLREGMLT